MNRSIGLTLGIGLSLAGCGGAPEHSTSWYVQHRDAAMAQVDACDRMAISDRGAECVNAQAAVMQIALHGKPSVRNPGE